jgi:spore maturation protein CgeB
MGDEYNYTINRFQIALVFLSKLNHDTYTRRCFEIPATKTLMLCEYSDDMNSLFPENECAVYFRSKEDLAEKIKYLLCNPGEIDRIAKNGFERLKVIGGSEVDRCSEIISDVTVLNSI